MNANYIMKTMSLALITAYFSLRVFVYMSLSRKGEKFFHIIKNWSYSIIQTAGLKVKVNGLENVPAEPVIFASTHSSLFDIPVLFSVLSGKLSIVYKKELDKVPLFGAGMKKTPFIAIDRSNARSALESLKIAVKKINDGYSIIIFPEGTRSKDGRLQSFKRGAFMLASLSGAKVVPVTIKGTYEINPPGAKSIQPMDVQMYIGKAIDIGNRSGKEAEKYLSEKVHYEMKKYY